MKKQQNFSKIFTSKANVLEFLKDKISESKIEKLYYFSVNEWNYDNTIILKNISKIFSNNLVIIRSSAMGEDSIDKSEAGNYLSIQKVDSSSKQKLRNGINKIIKSYAEKDNNNLKNQILVQKQATNIITSGVIFTKSINTESSYYLINYDDGKNTDSVTKGEVGNIIKIFRYIKFSSIPKKWKKLIKSVQEIEKIVKTDLLDIEFGIDRNNKIIIFQVRPLTILKNNEIKNLKNNEIKNLKNNSIKLLEKNKKSFLKLQKSSSLIGKNTVFSDMCDWNPAEIIGNNPNLLDYSLYDYLIMRKTWHTGREKLGYSKVDTPSLMVKFGQKPYVDVQASFNSLLPEKIPERLKNKLVNYYLKKLIQNPFLHDKVEFEILFTCHDPSLKNRLKDLEKNNFSKKEISTLNEILKEFTNNIIENFPNILCETLHKIDRLQENRHELLKKLKQNRNHITILNTIEQLLNDCRDIGTLYFSLMARLAFISSIIMKGLIENGLLEKKMLEDFMGNLNTPLTEIQNDLNSYVKGTFSKKEFLLKYGHLRPGTYDINAIRYDNDVNFFNNVKFLKTKDHDFQFKEKKFKNIIQENLPYDSEKFMFFAKESIIQREKIKFEFTKNLSDVLELIAEIGDLFEFSREEISNLSIDFILKCKNQKDFRIKNLWKKKIKFEKNSKILNNYLTLPPLLIHKNDFEIQNHYISKPNFITSKKIIAETYQIKTSKKINDLKNKIILIENADPGYDWIFTKNISGLITKYGGVASHMSIRCSELGLPAAIGCGDILFEQLQNSQKVMLDCKYEHIITLQQKNEDRYIEEKKLLKSLGYIK